MIDPYKTLGIEETASEGAIHRAAREQIFTHHPDRNGGTPEANAKLTQVIAAYEMLKTPEARARTDEARRAAERARTDEARRAADMAIEIMRAKDMSTRELAVHIAYYSYLLFFPGH